MPSAPEGAAGEGNHLEGNPETAPRKAPNQSRASEPGLAFQFFIILAPHYIWELGNLGNANQTTI